LQNVAGTIFLGVRLVRVAMPGYQVLTGPQVSTFLNLSDMSQAPRPVEFLEFLEALKKGGQQSRQPSQMSSFVILG
jgi:hypothetical protein